MSVSTISGEDSGPGFKSAVPALLFLASIFFLNFTSRVIFSPLLPVIGGELDLSHLDSGSLFFFISAGYFVSILLSGYVSSRISHRRTIVLSSCLSGLLLMALSACHSLAGLRLGLAGLGMAAGLYLPSGLAMIGRLVPGSYLARGIAVHELAPNLSFVITPLLAAGILYFLSWRQGLVLLGILLAVAGLVYNFRGARSNAFGTKPQFSVIRRLVCRSDFWMVTVLFSMAICSTLGIYAMLPLYLVAEQGMDDDTANMLLSLSRIGSVAMPIVGGWIGDRFGNRRVMGAVLLISGLLTIPMGLLDGWSLIVFVVLQPMAAVCFFPSGFVVLSDVGPGDVKNRAVPYVIPLAFLTGGGLLPTFIGGIGDVSSLSLGLVVAGGCMAAASLCSLKLMDGRR